MTTVNLTLNLPDGLAQAASSAGLLFPDIIEKMLADALKKQTIDSFFSAADKLSASNLVPMTLKEIQGEVEICRSAKKMGFSSIDSSKSGNV